MPKTSTSFKPGQSGNPGGRPAELGEFRALCRKRTKSALNALIRALKDPDKAVAAAKVLLEFGYGKAHQSMDVGHSFGNATDEQLEARFRELISKAQESKP